MVLANGRRFPNPVKCSKQFRNLYLSNYDENRKLNNQNTHCVSPTNEPNHTQQNQKKFHFCLKFPISKRSFKFFSINCIWLSTKRSMMDLLALTAFYSLLYRKLHSIDFVESESATQITIFIVKYDEYSIVCPANQIRWLFRINNFFFWIIGIITFVNDVTLFYVYLWSFANFCYFFQQIIIIASMKIHYLFASPTALRYTLHLAFSLNRWLDPYLFSSSDSPIKYHQGKQPNKLYCEHFNDVILENRW